VTDHAYVGNELDLFASARQWKTYWAAEIRRFVRGHVLEVGAGIGTNTVLLCDPSRHRWTSLEPDAALAARLRERVDRAFGPGAVRTVVAAGDVFRPGTFDTVLYVDVLEHIEEDRAELERSAALLKPDGHLVVIAPAHQFLYSAFDRAIGHHRRYSRSDLLSLTPATLAVTRAVYLDSVGLAASLANRVALRQSLPTPAQIRTWDSVMVPASRVLDRLLGFSCGKSVCAIWTKVTA
jgi:SAM-dependent methyltransferase